MKKSESCLQSLKFILEKLCYIFNVNYKQVTCEAQHTVFVWVIGRQKQLIMDGNLSG